MTEKTITLPLPSIDLSPNRRVHWAKKAKQVKIHRSRARWAALAVLEPSDRIESYMLYFFYPDKRRRDDDNYTSRCKSYLDGISDRIKQDDSEWHHNGVRRDLDREDPRVEIRVVLKEHKSSWHHDERP